MIVNLIIIGILIVIIAWLWKLTRRIQKIEKLWDRQITIEIIKTKKKVEDLKKEIQKLLISAEQNQKLKKKYKF